VNQRGASSLLCVVLETIDCYCVLAADLTLRKVDVFLWEGGIGERGNTFGSRHRLSAWQSKMRDGTHARLFLAMSNPPRENLLVWNQLGREAGSTNRTLASSCSIPMSEQGAQVSCLTRDFSEREPGQCWAVRGLKIQLICRSFQAMDDTGVTEREVICRQQQALFRTSLGPNSSSGDLPNVQIGDAVVMTFALQLIGETSGACTVCAFEIACW
jgi:hypothetical protein